MLRAMVDHLAQTDPPNAISHSKLKMRCTIYLSY